MSFAIFCAADLIKYEDTIIWGSFNGRTTAFGAVNLGSNPSPQAKQKQV